MSYFCYYRIIAKIAHFQTAITLRFYGRCENPECRNITEYHGICRNTTEYTGISRHFPGIYRNITIFYEGSHATVYKRGRLTTYFITKVMYLSHFDGK
jgi:hypothetical protein